MLDLREGVRKETANHLLSTVHHVPVGDDLGLFRALVPDGAHDEESRLANGLKDTEECSDGNEGGESEADGVQAQSRRPEHNVDSKELGNGDTLDRPVDGVLNDKDSEVNTGGQPSKLRTNERLYRDWCTISDLPWS